MFEKNMDFLTPKEAEKIENTKVAVIGTGALGQMVTHELVRSGFKDLILMDPDRMDYSNFNRQLYAAYSVLDQFKAEILAAQMKDIAPDIRLQVYTEFLDGSNGQRIIAGRDILVDCVDDIRSKLYMEQLAESLNIPLVHGAVEGWFGQITSVYPGDRILSKLYQTKRQQKVTAMAVTVNTIASLQAAEVIKIAIENENILRKKVLFVDLWASDFSYMNLELN